MKPLPFLIAIIGTIAGCILGTTVMLFWYVNSGEYMGIMVGSGLGFLIIVPIASFILGGVPGAIIGGLLGAVLGILGIQVEELLKT